MIVDPYFAIEGQLSKKQDRHVRLYSKDQNNNEYIIEIEIKNNKLKKIGQSYYSKWSSNADNLKLSFVYDYSDILQLLGKNVTFIISSNFLKSVSFGNDLFSSYKRIECNTLEQAINFAKILDVSTDKLKTSNSPANFTLFENSYFKKIKKEKMLKDIGQITKDEFSKSLEYQKNTNKFIRLYIGVYSTNGKNYSYNIESRVENEKTEMQAITMMEFKPIDFKNYSLQRFMDVTRIQFWDFQYTGIFNEKTKQWEIIDS